MPVLDDVFGRASMREDGRVVTPIYPFEVKRPEESTGPWDCHELVATVPAEEAWRPPDEDGCPFVRRPDHPAAAGVVENLPLPARNVGVGNAARRS
jgi:hypothetical protein